MVEGGRDVSHQSHEEEWHLQDLVGGEVQSLDERVIPCHGVEVYHE